MIAVLLLANAGAHADLTHRYTFNDGTANDDVGNANGALMNGARVANGELVLANNGTSTSAATGQYMALPSNILRTRDFSLEVWFTWNGGAPWERLLDFGNSVPSSGGTIGQGFIILTLNAQSEPLGQISINSWGNPSDTDYVYDPQFGAFPRGGEHCLTYIHNFDGHSESLFLDGRIVGVASAHVDPSTAAYSNFWLGRSQFSQDPFFDGSIDQLSTFNNALSAAQVLSDYQAGPVVTPEPFVLGLVAMGSGGMLLHHGRRPRRGASSP